MIGCLYTGIEQKLKDRLISDTPSVFGALNLDAPTGFTMSTLTPIMINKKGKRFTSRVELRSGVAAARCYLMGNQGQIDKKVLE